MELNPHRGDKASNRGKCSDCCRITDYPNKPLFPAEYLGQLNHSSPTLKSYEGHEVSEIGERGVRQKIRSAY